MGDRHAILRLAAHLLLAPLLLVGLVLLAQGMTAGLLLVLALLLHALLFGYPASLAAAPPWLSRAGAGVCAAALLTVHAWERAGGPSLQAPWSALLAPGVRQALLGLLLTCVVLSLVQAVGARPQPLPGEDAP